MAWVLAISSNTGCALLLCATNLAYSGHHFAFILANPAPVALNTAAVSRATVVTAFKAPGRAMPGAHWARGPAEGEALSQLGKEGLLAQHRRASTFSLLVGIRRKSTTARLFCKVMPLEREYTALKSEHGRYRDLPHQLPTPVSSDKLVGHGWLLENEVGGLLIYFTSLHCNF